MNILILLIPIFAVAFAAENGYEGYKVYRVSPSGEGQIKALREFGKNNKLDFLSKLGRHGKPVDVMVPPEDESKFANFLQSNSINNEVSVNNVQEVVRKGQRQQSLTPRGKLGKVDFTRYLRHNEINVYLHQLAKEHPDLVTLETIGKSYEERELVVIKISSNSSAKHPVIFIDAGIHAREWISPPVALYTIYQLVENKTNLYLLDKVDWHILPVVNPDGYEFTHESEDNRLWRKTRSQGKECVGTDANRNFAYHWAEVGSSDDECDEIYHGQNTLSEPEASSVADYLRNTPNIQLYLTFHGYGQLILYPWGYTADLPDNNEELLSLGQAVGKSIEDVAGNGYEVGSSTNVLYEAAGGSDDYAKGVAGVELAYTIELPEGGELGFDPPPSDILPIVTETWEGIKTFHNYIVNKFYPTN